MRHTAETLARSREGDKRIVSAHRTPERLFALPGRKTAGFKIIIAGAGGQHLPG